MVRDINQNVVTPLSHTTLRIGVLNPSGQVVTVASPGGCNLSASSINLDASRGVSFGGGRLGGLGDLAALPASAGDASAIAIGNGASTVSGGRDAVAIGSGASASADAVSLGALSVASATGSVALGRNSTADRGGLAGATEAFSGVGVASTNGAVSVGAAGAERQIINVAGGTQPTDAVNLRQLSTLGGHLADGLGGGASFDAASGVWTPPSFTIQGSSFRSVGDAFGAVDARLSSNASAIAATSSGLQVLQSQFATSSTGLVVQDPTTRSITLGAGTNGTSLNVAGTLGNRRIAGVATGAAADDAVNVSQLSAALAGVTAGGNPAFAVDNRASLAPARATGADGLAVGYGADAAAARSVALGSGSVATQAGTVSVGAVGAERRIVNVAPGIVAAGSTDAVNSGQLYSTNQQVAANTTSITTLLNAAGSGSSGLVLLDTTAQTITIGAGAGSTQLNIAGTSGNRRISGVASGVAPNEAVNVAQLNTALGNISVGGGTAAVSSSNDSNVAAALATGRDSTALGHGAAASADRSLALGNGSVADQANSVSIGAPGSERRLVNVANGSVGSRSTDAVNGSQLYVIEQAVAANTASLQTMQTGSVLPGTGYIVQNTTSRLLTIGAGVDGTAISLANQSGAGRIVQGVADGIVQLGSTQAVNGGQLASTNERATVTATSLSRLASRLGGGASYDAATTAFSGPVYKLRGSSYTDVGSALSALDAAIQMAGGTGPSGQSDDFPIRDNNTNGAAGPRATGANALATGHGAQATAAGSQAIGSMALAKGVDSTSVGSKSTASGDRSTAGGANSEASGTGSAAYGQSSLASAEATTAIGTGSKATYAGATAIGAGARASADPTTAVGFEAEATGNEASSFGGYASATAQNATAIGRSASATDVNATALGVSAKAQAVNSTAVGYGAVAGHENATAIGAGAATSRANQVAVGTARSTYTLAGLDSAESRGAQMGRTRLVTTDAAGNLGVSDYDPGSVTGLQNQIGELGAQVSGIGQYAMASRREARQGIAAAMAMTAASMPSLPGRTSWTANTATFRGEWAGGVALAHRLDTRMPIAITAGFSYSQINRQGIRAGLAGEF